MWGIHLHLNVNLIIRTWSLVLDNNRTQPVYKARAAANTPTAPPTRAMAPVGRGPAGAKPVLGEGVAAAPDGEPDAPERDAPEPDATGPDPDATGPDPDATGPDPDAPEREAVGVAPELSGVCDASTIATVLMASYSLTDAEDMTVVSTVRSVASTYDPSTVAVHVKSAAVMAPCQLQFMFTVHRPGDGSVKCISHVEAPCLIVYGSQRLGPSSLGSSLKA
jgi:hypothetical protein